MIIIIIINHNHHHIIHHQNEIHHHHLKIHFLKTTSPLNGPSISPGHQSFLQEPFETSLWWCHLWHRNVILGLQRGYCHRICRHGSECLIWTQGSMVPRLIVGWSVDGWFTLLEINISHTWDKRKIIFKMVPGVGWFRGCFTTPLEHTPKKPLPISCKGIPFIVGQGGIAWGVL